MKYSMEFVKGDEFIKDEKSIKNNKNVFIVPPPRSNSEFNEERFESLKAHYKKLLIKQEITRKESRKLVDEEYNKK